MKGRSGFTLVELLIAAGILAILLSALGAMFSGTLRAYRVNERTSDAHQNIEATIQLLKYEIALAGYRGTDTGARNRSFNSLATLEVPSSADSVTIRFYEDRYVTTPVLRTVTFEVNNRTLTRKEGNNNPVPVADGVTKLEVKNYLLSNGKTSTTLPAERKDLAGITLALTFNNTMPVDASRNITRDVTVALHNTQE